MEILGVIFVVAFLAVWFGVLGSILWRVVRHGGLRGGLYGAPVGRTLAEMPLRKRGVGKQTIRVQLLRPQEPSEGPHVGLELEFRSFASWSLRPVALTREEARKLGEWLVKAAGE